MQLTFQVSWTLLTSIVLETELQISWAELELSFSERALSSAQLSKILPQLSSGNFFQNLQFCLKITKCGPREPRCKSNAVRRPVITLLFLNFKTLKMFIANGWSNKAALRVCFSSPVQQWLNHVSHFFLPVFAFFAVREIQWQQNMNYSFTETFRNSFTKSRSIIYRARISKFEVKKKKLRIQKSAKIWNRSGHPRQVG